MWYLDLAKKEIREQQGSIIRFEFYLVFMIFNISTPCKARESGFKVVINQIRELTIQQSANAK